MIRCQSGRLPRFSGLGFCRVKPIVFLTFGRAVRGDGARIEGRERVSGRR